MAARELLRGRLILVGPGRAGRAFLRSWSRAGGSQPRIIGGRGEAPGILGGRGEPPGSPLRAGALPPGEREETDLLVLAVPDDAIGRVAEDLASSIACSVAFHLSGALAAAELSPLRRRGAAVASLHPLRAFTGGPEEDWAGAFVAVEGDSAAVAAGGALATSFGATPHTLTAAGKPLYHAAASLAAAGTVALVSLAARLWEEAGIPEGAGRPALAALALGALEKARDSSFERALTGPVERRDVETVRAHWRALAGRRSLCEIYRTLAEEVLRATEGRGAEEELRRVFKDADELPRRKRR